MKLRTQIISLVLSTLIFSGLVLAWVFISVSVKDSQSYLNDYHILMGQQMGLDLKNKINDLEKLITRSTDLKINAPYIEEINFEITGKNSIKELSVLNENFQYVFAIKGKFFRVVLNSKFFGPKIFSDKKIKLSYIFKNKGFSFNKNQPIDVHSELSSLLLEQKQNIISSVTLKDTFYTIIPAFSGHIVVTSPTSHLYSIFNDYIGKTTPYFLGILILFVLLSWWISSKIAHPLENLTHWTKKISSGQWNVALESSTNTEEIGRLEEAFKLMGKELQERESKLMQSERLSALGQISVGIAHEIKNPLNIISSYAQLLLRKTTEEEEIKKLSIIEDEVNRAANIVNDLMVYAGHRPLNIKSIQLSYFIKKVNSSLTPDVLKKVTFNNLSTIENINIDEDFFHQVLINLIINAHHATENLSDAKIVVQYSNDDENSLVSIADNGSGITDKDLPHIFEPFYTTKTVGKGTGLGLAFCHGIVQKHNGTIAVNSDPTNGTEFVLKIPNS